MLISPVLEFSLLYGEDYDPLSWALGLPSLAAVNLESKGVTARAALRLALREAEPYALSDYLVELASGAEAGGKARAATVAASPVCPLESSSGTRRASPPPSSSRSSTAPIPKC